MLMNVYGDDFQARASSRSPYSVFATELTMSYAPCGINIYQFKIGILLEIKFTYY